MEVIVDAGANRGAWAGEAWQRWPLAEIHAFEPATETFALLSAAVGKNVLCRNAALGDHEGTADLHQVPGLDGLSSLHRRDLAAHGMDMTKSEVVQVVTLDGYCEANDIERIDFLKMDVEGHEMSVLDGAKGLLLERRIERIQFEFGGANIDSRTYLRDFVRLLEGGFDIFRLLKDGQIPLNYRERDEVFVTTNFFADRKRSIN